MENTGERPFAITDAMILIAATAIGLGVLRDWAAPVLTGPLPPLMSFVDWPYHVLGTLNFYWTLAIVGIRLRRPRPSPHRLGRQPGFVLGLAVILTTLIHALLGTSDILLAGRVRWDQVYDFLLNLAPAQKIGPAVAVAWMVLALSGRWQPNAGWIDRLGRFAAYIWLGMLLYIFVKVILFAIGVLRY